MLLFSIIDRESKLLFSVKVNGDHTTAIKFVYGFVYNICGHHPLLLKEKEKCKYLQNILIWIKIKHEGYTNY